MMLDRKSWIILALCGLGIVVNMHFSQKNREAHHREAQEQLELKEKENPQIENPATDSAGISAPLTSKENLLPDKKEETKETPKEPAQQVFIENENTRFVLTNQGGGVKFAEFKKQREVGKSDALVRLNRFDSQPVGALALDFGQSFLGETFAISQQGEKSVEFIGKLPNGLVVEKKWETVSDEKKGGDYRLKLTLTIENPSEASIDTNGLSLFAGSAAPLHAKEGGGGQTSFFYSHSGKFKVKRSGHFKGGITKKRTDSYKSEAEILDYVGVGNQFFSTVISSEDSRKGIFWARKLEVILADEDKTPKVAARVGFSLGLGVLAPRERKSMTFEVFMGPKDNKILRDMGKEQVMDYGFFGIISNLLNKILNWFHDVVFSKVATSWAWGFSIIAITLLVRILIWPLHNSSHRTMKRMSQLQPKIAKLKEKYPNDQQRVGQAQMKLFREHGVNPMGGCLPMFAQLPIFLGFYRMLQNAVELRQQPFLWVNDLSQPDTLMTIPLMGGFPLNLLPLLMGGSMLLQMQFTPKNGDKMQQRIFMLMPIMFLFICYNFAAALSLYWTTSNLFSVFQTIIMKKLPEPKLKTKKDGVQKKSWMEKMQEKVEASQKHQQTGQRSSPSSKPATKSKKKRPPRTGK